MKKILVLFSILFLISGVSFAQTLLETQFSGSLGSGARALGMGGAFIAVADDATATSWNPGGLGQIENLEISAVGSYYSFNRLEPSISMTNFILGTSYHTGDSWAFDFLSVSVPVRPFKGSDFKVVFQYSYQRFINFNISSNTNATSFQNLTWEYQGLLPVYFLEQGYRYTDEEYEGGLDSHSLSVGVQLTSWANIGVTMNLWTNGFEGGKYIEETYNVTNILTQESASGFRQEVEERQGNFRGTSFNIGALIHVTNNLNLGMVYKNEFTFDDEDDDGTLKGKITYPQSVGLGIAYRPVDNLTLAFDFTQTDWSKGKAVYEDEELFFPMLDLPYWEPSTEQERVDRIREYQHDTKQFRFGAEYVIIGEDILVPLRAGIYFDRQYFADANGSIPVYTGLTAGAGVVWNGIVLDFAVIYLSSKYQTEYFSTANTDFNYVKAVASMIIRL